MNKSLRNGLPPLAKQGMRHWLVQAERVALIGVVAVLIGLFSVMPATSEIFVSLANLQGLALTQSVIAIAALAATIPLVAGQFDVSVGPILGMTSVLVGVLTVQQQVPVPLAILTSILAGGIVGAVSGWVIAYVRANSFIITLATGTLISGLVTLFTNNQIITDAPPSLVAFGTGLWLGIPWLGWSVICVAVLASFFLRYTVRGRRFALVGSNRNAARIVGVHVERTIFSSFVISGLISGMAGVLLFAQTGAANPQIGAGYTLPALAAAVLGATCIRPGHFNIPGTIVGVLFVAVAVDGLTLAGAADWVQPVFDGAGLLIAVAISSLLARNSNRRLA